MSELRLRILCFGDSLTAGFQSPSPDCPEYLETPYGEFLQTRLGDRAHVCVSGMCGELTAEMVRRFPGAAAGVQPVWAIILGGTNDLGWNVPPADILRNLGALHEHAAAHGIRSVAVTVPSIRGFDDHIPRRRELNGSLAEYCTGRKIPCVDLFAATAESETGCLAEPYSNDGLHLTTAGYQLLAHLLYEQVFQAI